MVHSFCGGYRTKLTLTAAAGIVWLIALVEIPSKWIPHGTVLSDWYNTRTDRAVVYDRTAVAHWTRYFVISSSSQDGASGNLREQEAT